MIAVISYSKREFDDFIKYLVCHDDVNKFKCVKCVDDIRGINFTNVIRIGQFFRIRNIDELYSHALSRVKT